MALAPLDEARDLWMRRGMWMPHDITRTPIDEYP